MRSALLVPDSVTSSGVRRTDAVSEPGGRRRSPEHHSTACGVTVRRLRVGDHRMLCAVGDEVIHVLVTHPGRTA
ncbi:hypothetical protein [Streptomyces sp. NPDC020362]|uniref:type II toxin-antitoxin system RelE family toxin n=1 Tax=unclassified Streptomyces TaxID=2593676 RepID=UPI0033F201C9